MKVEMQKAECRELSDAELDCVTGGSILSDINQAAHELGSEISHVMTVIKYGSDPMTSQH
jgi:hypothetical protein